MAESYREPNRKKYKCYGKHLYDMQRGTSYERGYDNAWKEARLAHLREHPLCEDCLKKGRYVPGQEVHHVIKLKDVPELKYDPSNLMTLCKSCHSKRTMRGE